MTNKTPNLRLMILIPQSSVQANNSIEVTIKLINVDTQPIKINKRLLVNNYHAPSVFRELSFIITSSNGEVLPFTRKINVGFVKPADFKILNPGEHVETTFSLDQGFNLTTPGSYSLKAIYENQSGSEEDRLIWKGTLNSNNVIFTIK